MPEIPSYQSRTPPLAASGLTPTEPAVAGGGAIEHGFSNLAGGLLFMAHAQQRQNQLDQVQQAGELLDKAERQWLNTRDDLVTNPDLASLQTQPLNQYAILKEHATTIAAETVRKARELGPAAAKYVTTNLHSRFATHLEAFGKEATQRQQGQNAVNLFMANLADTSLGRAAVLGDTQHLNTIVARSAAYQATNAISYAEFKTLVQTAQNDIQQGQASTWVNQHSQEWLDMRRGDKFIANMPKDIQAAFKAITSMPGVDLDALSEKARSTENFIREGRAHKELVAANATKELQEHAANNITDAILESTATKPFTHHDLINHPLYKRLEEGKKRTLAHEVRILEHTKATHNNLLVYGSLRDKLNSPFATIINEVSNSVLQNAAEGGHLTYEAGTDLINLRNVNLRLLNNTKASTFVKEAQDAHHLLTQFFRPLQGTIESAQQRAAWDSAMTEFNGIFWKEMHNADLKQLNPDQLDNYISPSSLAQEIFKKYGTTVSRMRTDQLKATLSLMGTPQSTSELQRRLMLEDALIEQQQRDIEAGIDALGGKSSSPSGSKLGPKPTQ